VRTPTGTLETRGATVHNLHGVDLVIARRLRVRPVHGGHPSCGSEVGAARFLIGPGHVFRNARRRPRAARFQRPRFDPRARRTISRTSASRSRSAG
jgi:hypothetical protein